VVKVLVGANMFESKAQTLVNTVNTVGVMGKGIALEFKRRFPEMYDEYVTRCKAGLVKLGEPYLYKKSRPWVLNFPTKDHWRSVSRINDIVRGLKYLYEQYRDWGIESLAVPPLGCGSGQLEWRVVGRTLYRWLTHFDIPVELYAPYGTPKEQVQLSFLEQEVETETSAPITFVEPGWVALVEIVDRIKKEPHHWPIGRVSFQKIAYFATLTGIPTKLEYKRASFGPFAPELKRVQTRLVNNGLICENRIGNMFAIDVGPTFKDARRAYGPQLQRWSREIERVVDLFLRIQTKDAEVAATVSFAARNLYERLKRKPTEAEVYVEVIEWKRRRRPPVAEADVALAIRGLSMLGWLDVEGSKDLPLEDEALLGA
jgi:O-acetyl-ADP-ribose deacetylase (regulator of RNase III)/uncharacterized protein YwgA